MFPAVSRSFRKEVIEKSPPPDQFDCDADGRRDVLSLPAIADRPDGGDARFVASAFREPDRTRAECGACFVISGAPYAYPAVRGEATIGFPTSHAVPPLSEQIQPSAELPPVWPHQEGTLRGQGVLPLYENLPLAAVDDSKLYELLALFDALRIGQARERELAKKLLEQRLQ